jgi:hypothetical protein
MHYPVILSPNKSLSLEKTPNFTGRLTGIKGYLLFEDGTVFYRSSEGYVVKIVYEK